MEWLRDMKTLTIRYCEEYPDPELLFKGCDPNEEDTVKDLAPGINEHEAMIEELYKDAARSYIGIDRYNELEADEINRRGDEFASIVEQCFHKEQKEILLQALGSYEFSELIKKLAPYYRQKSI